MKAGEPPSQGESGEICPWDCGQVTPLNTSRLNSAVKGICLVGYSRYIKHPNLQAQSQDNKALWPVLAPVDPLRIET